MVHGSPASAGIDPFLHESGERLEWLPRIRGDRPAASIAVSTPATAPPHPRGSTRLPGPDQVHHGGSPASAGIDPRTGSSGSRQPRLPRIRGDRPRAAFREWIEDQAPPHPRGSTRAGKPSSGARPGSPASAGIDRRRRVRSRSPTRLPRIRGDRPDQATVERIMSGAPPHPRGSTLGRVGIPAALVGSPASAGIDPGRAIFARVRRRLPRIRGDRPETACPEGP